MKKHNTLLKTIIIISRCCQSRPPSRHHHHHHDHHQDHHHHRQAVRIIIITITITITIILLIITITISKQFRMHLLTSGVLGKSLLFTLSSPPPSDGLEREFCFQPLPPRGPASGGGLCGKLSPQGSPLRCGRSMTMIC